MRYPYVCLSLKLYDESNDRILLTLTIPAGCIRGSSQTFERCGGAQRHIQVRQPFALPRTFHCTPLWHRTKLSLDLSIRSSR